MDSYKIALKVALKMPNVLVSVGDVDEDLYDLTKSRKYREIVEACEATDFAVMEFFQDGKSQGQMSVLVGEGEESICDHHVNSFFDHITGDFNS